MRPPTPLDAAKSGVGGLSSGCHAFHFATALHHTSLVFPQNRSARVSLGGIPHFFPKCFLGFFILQRVKLTGLLGKRESSMTLQAEHPRGHCPMDADMWSLGLAEAYPFVNSFFLGRT